MRGSARESESHHSPRVPAWGFAPFLAAALALAAGEARALIEVEVLSGVIEAGKFASVSVDCPPGTIAIGGGTQVSDNAGMDLTGNGPRFGDTALLSMPDGPAGAPSGWLGSAENTSGSDGTLHVGVLCAPGLAVGTVVGSAAVGSGTFAGVTAECPEGSVAIGGGVALGNLGLRIVESGPRMPQTGALAGAEEGAHEAPDAWTAFARNPGGGSPILKVAALCADFTNTAVSTHVAARNTMANGGPAGGDVECPEGERALGGGIASLNPLGLTVTSSAPWFAGDEQELVQQPDGTSPAPVGWNARGRNDSPDVLSVKRAAICLPEPGGAAAALAAFAALGGAARRRRKASACGAAGGGRGATARAPRCRDVGAR
jgi:hypothetical protein